MNKNTNTLKVVKIIKILELFSGTQSISKVFKKYNWETFTVEKNSLFKDITSYNGDVLDLSSEYIKTNFGRPNVIWASPPCTTYSIAAISHHRFKEENGNLSPKSDFAKESDKILLHTLKLIEELKPDFWFIENPNFKPMCKNGSPCHESAPRGSKTGTQGLKNSIERSRIPSELCEAIFKMCN